MRLWVFSDLHLTDSSEPLYRSFLKVLAEPKSEKDTVVFAGDIFDLLVGDSPYFKHKFGEFFLSIQKLVSLGVRIYYIEGNHDFHLRSLFPKEVQFRDEAVEIRDLEDQAHEKKIYIAHGDLVDQADTQYLYLRKLLRSSVLKLMIKLTPGPWIQKLGQSWSRPLSQKENELPSSWSAERLSRLRETFRVFAENKKRQGFDYIILGHCHDLDEVRPYYFNMGYPLVHRQYLFYESSSDEQKELLNRVNFPGF